MCSWIQEYLAVAPITSVVLILSLNTVFLWFQFSGAGAICLKIDCSSACVPHDNKPVVVPGRKSTEREREREKSREKLPVTVCDRLWNALEAEQYTPLDTCSVTEIDRPWDFKMAAVEGRMFAATATPQSEPGKPANQAEHDKEGNPCILYGWGQSS